MPAPKAVTTLSSLEFNQDTDRAKRAARRGPVVITDRGRPSYVLLTFRASTRLSAHGQSVINLLGAPPGVEDVEIEVPAFRSPVRPTDLT